VVDHELVARVAAAFESWATSLSADERTALREYQANAYIRVNEILRDIDDGSSLNDEELGRVDEMIETLDSAIARGTVPFSVEVHRGVREVVGWLGDDLPNLVGTTFTDAGFISTSLDIDSAANKVSLAKHPAIFSLELPAGQDAAWLPPIGKVALRDELELLLPRNTSIRITGVSSYRGIPMIRGEVI
jgi:ADP-ribosyltransferase exoenzyme